jgi:hypothetical protein
METNNKQIHWKHYNDEWNNDIYQKDTNNKALVSNNNEYFIEVSTEVIDEVKNTQSTSISIDEINDLIDTNNVKNNNDLVNLDNVIKVINWCTFNCTIDETNYKQFLRCITWVCGVIKYFMMELVISEISETANKNSTELTRSSYRLCPNKSNCMYQYPDQGDHPKSCKYQHYPYANLLLDCTSIVNYINHYFVKNDNSIAALNNSKTSKVVMALASYSVLDKEFNVQELRRCLTTINFVFMIMYRELDTINKCRNCENDYNIRKYHAYHKQFNFVDNKNNSKKRNKSNQKYN